MSARTLVNIQGLLCFACVLFIALRKPKAGNTDPVSSLFQRSTIAGLAGVLLIAWLLFLPSLNDPLLSDDHILIRSTASSANFVQAFVKPSGDGTMRPVGQLVFGAYKLWAQTNPLRWHCLGLILHSINVVLLYILTFRLTASARISLLASALFGVHGAHAEPVAWVAATFDVLATLFSLATLIALVSRSESIRVLSLPLLALAVLSKESAYASPGIAFAVLICFRQWDRRRAILLLACSGLAGCLFIDRLIVFKGPGGAADPSTGRAQILNITPSSFLQTLVYRPWRTLIVPENLVDSGSQAWTIALSFALLSGLIYAGFFSLLPRRTTGLLLAAICVSLIPPIHVASIRPDLLGTRVFYLPSLLFAIWLSCLVCNLPKAIQRHAVAGLVIILNATILRINLGIRQEVAYFGDDLCSTLSRNAKDYHGTIVVRGVPSTMKGVYLFANGLSECVQTKSGNAATRIIRESTASPEGNSEILEWIQATRAFRRAK